MNDENEHISSEDQALADEWAAALAEADTATDQDEIDALLGNTSGASSIDGNEGNEEELLSEMEKDTLGEIGNISMGTSATTLFTLLGQKVTITTPKVKVLDIAERGRLGCGQDVHCRGTLKILEGLGENPDLSRLDHLQGGVQNGSSCSSLGPHSDPVAGIKAPLSGFYYIEHHFVLTYLDIKWANL